jgi:ATP-dependent DNA helicase PIF1
MTQAQALDILKTGANVFLTGEPGSGKTHTVNQYVAYLRSHGVAPAITASTGIAATHIGGITIHSWSGIGIRTTLTKRDLDDITSKEHVVKRVRKTAVLIIDEVSMLSPGTLAAVEAVCREVKRSSEPFGGIQVVLVGDFFQLPPVMDTAPLNQRATLLASPDERFAYSAAAWTRAGLLTCYLTEQHRQDDSDFLGVLTAIRRNQFTEQHRSHLVGRQIDINAVPPDVPQLYSHNVDVDRVNEAKLATIPGRAYTFVMASHGPEKLVAALAKGCLSPETLSLKVGATVMFTKNSPLEGFVNGTLGTVVRFSSDNNYPVVEVRGGRKITVEPAEWVVEENGRIRAGIRQLPLRLAWAMTVHKSQGISLDAAIMDLGAVFEFGQGYVALSRVRRLDGLYLLGWNERAFQVHPDVIAQDELFRVASSDAGAAFAELSSSELRQMQDNFIVACGGTKAVTADGTPSSVAKVKVDTVAETARLLAEGKSLAEVAAARSLKHGTIVSHVEKLKEQNPSFDLSFLQSELPARAKEIKSALLHSRTEKGEYPLGPAKARLGATFSYGEIRLVRLLLLG